MRVLDPVALPPRRRVLVPVLACAAAAVPASASAAPPTSAAAVPARAASAASRVVLDPSPGVVDVAAQGATVAWLSGTVPAGGGEVVPDALSVRDAGATTARRLALRLPRGTSGVAVGTDAAGAPVALLATRTHTWTVPLEPAADPVARRIPGSARWKAVAMLRGRVAYARTSSGRTRVLVARRVGAAGRVAFTLPRGYAPVDLALGRGDVVFAHGGRAVDVGTADVVWRAAGGTGRQVLAQSTGGASENGMGPVTITRDGARANVSRWNVGGGHPNDLTTFSVGSGRALSSVRTTRDPGAEAVLQLGLDAGESVIAAAAYSGCSTPTTSDPSGVPCLGVSLLPH